MSLCVYVKTDGSRAVIASEGKEAYSRCICNDSSRQPPISFFRFCSGGTVAASTGAVLLVFIVCIIAHIQYEKIEAYRIAREDCAEIGTIKVCTQRTQQQQQQHQQLRAGSSVLWADICHTPELA